MERFSTDWKDSVFADEIRETCRRILAQAEIKNVKDTSWCAMYLKDAQFLTRLEEGRVTVAKLIWVKEQLSKYEFEQSKG